MPGHPCSCSVTHEKGYPPIFDCALTYQKGCFWSPTQGKGDWRMGCLPGVAASPEWATSWMIRLRVEGWDEPSLNWKNTEMKYDISGYVIPALK
jgi:hypothetical protein